MRKGKQALWAAIGVVALAALVAAATAPARTSAPAAPIKAAWIYVGPHNDGGWSQAHDLGRLYVQKKLGKNVVTTYKESVPEGPQASQVIDSLVRDGNKIIFATSFGYMDAMAAAAKKYPDVYFEHATGYKTDKNYANYFGAGEDAIYLSGMAAGEATKKGDRRLHRPVPDPRGHPPRERVRARRRRRCKPGAKVRLVWTKSWFDPGKERKAAESLVAAGADVLGQNVDSPAAGQYAQSKGSRGSATTRTRRSSLRPRGSPRRRTTGARTTCSRVKAAADGSWKTGSYYGSMKDGLAGIAPFGPKVSAKTKALIAKKRSQIIKGTFYEFQGPLYDQAGKLRVPKGKRMTLQQILTVDWLVKGIVGSPKG